MAASQNPWWKEAVVYQIYPASFKDSNGDGLGDVPGIISELDYIKSLGVDVIWVCPMYDSPQVDRGYDISDYESVYPPFGTVADMEKLVSECHSRDIRVILDLVINHTSDMHAWFKESRASKDNPKRSWYIWRPARHNADGKRMPPTNWRGHFGGSAWTWDKGSQEYYLHLFCPEQPDLNWENDETRKAIYDSAIEFWLKKGVDGFRIDTVNMYSKNTAYPDAPVTDASNEFQFAPDLFANGPRMHEFLGEMQAILEKYHAMSVGELPHTPSREKVLKYVSAAAKQLDMVFQFDVVDIGGGKQLRYDASSRNWVLPAFKKAVAATQSLIEGTDAWTTAFLENHDQARSISRFGSDASTEERERSGKMLAMMLATLSGTLFIYQGQEIGMVNVPKEWPMSEYKDVDSHNYYEYVTEHYHGDPAAQKAARAALQHMARDNSRVPMQWDGSAQAGFTTSDKPWMRVNDNYPAVNVARQLHDPKSVLAFWRRMLQLRKEHAAALVHGIYRTLDEEDEHVFAFEKKAAAEGGTALVVLNFTNEKRPLDKAKLAGGVSSLKMLASTYDEVEVEDSLRPFEGRVYLVQK